MIDVIRVIIIVKYYTISFKLFSFLVKLILLSHVSVVRSLRKERYAENEIDYPLYSH